MKRTGTLAMCRLDNNTVLEKGLYFYHGNDFASELVYSIGRLCEPCLEHIDNNFKPLDTIQKELHRIQTQSGSIKVSMVYLTMIQEAQNVVTYTINLMKVSRKFQLTDGE